MCDNTGISLPELQSTNCLPCSSGQYYKGSTCQECSTGTYIENGAFGEICKDCPEGNYAPKLLNYTL
jgi:hypothetical protein